MSRLSEEGKKFLKRKWQDSGSTQLTVEQVIFLRNIIESRSGVKIYINGESPTGIKILSDRMSRVKRVIEKYNKIKIGYEHVAARYLVKEMDAMIPLIHALWYSGLSQVGFGAPSFYRPHVDSLSGKCRSDPEGWDDVFDDSKVDFSDLESRISDNPFSPFCSMASKLLDLFALLGSSKADIHLFYSKDAIEEMRGIQKTLREGEAVGYIYTGGSLKERRHVESFVITKDLIAKAGLFGVRDEDGVYDDSFYTLLTPREHQGFAVLSPQADSVSCGTLGLLYMESLLKNNAHAFFSEGLFLCLDRGLAAGDFTGSQIEQVFLSRAESNHDVHAPIRVWIPPARVLLYSQSRAFNRFLFDVVTSAEDRMVAIHRKKETYRYPALQRLALVTHQEINVLAFRAQWLVAYKKFSLLRQQSQVVCYFDPHRNEITKARFLFIGQKKDSGFYTKEGNRYLAFSSHKFQREVANNMFLKNIPMSRGLEGYAGEQILITYVVRAASFLHKIHRKYQRNLLLGGPLKRSVCKEFAKHLEELVAALRSKEQYDLKEHVTSLRLQNNGADWSAVIAGHDSDLKKFFDILEGNNYFNSQATATSDLSTRLPR